MHIRDRAIISVLSLVLIALMAAVVGPTLSQGEAQPTPLSSQAPLRPYVEGVVGSASSVGPFAARSVVEREITALLFRGLVRLGPNAELVGDLADRWSVNESGSEWTFHLRAGLAWQDGAPLTSADVVFTIRTLSDPAYAGPGAASWREVTATAPDPQTVMLGLATPLGGFLQAATQPIAPEHLLGGIDPAALPSESFGQQPVGSGSFRLTLLDASHALLLRHVSGPAAADGEGSETSAPATDSLRSASPLVPGSIVYPYLDGIDLRFFADEGALAAAWDLGELDGAAGVPAETAARFVSDGNSRVLRYPSNTLFDVTLNLRP
ncbi:MAG: ABC transporter substrate-binding protein, partial [Chloroflexota bacterium]